MKTSDLIGTPLNWAVAKAEGLAYRYDEKYGPMCFRPRLRKGESDWDSLPLPYSTDWSLGGPICEREWLHVTPWPNESDEGLRWQCVQHDNIDCMYFGPTPLIAAMRAYVASKLGIEIDVPKELL